MCGIFVRNGVVRPVHRCIKIWIASHRIKRAGYLTTVRNDESLVKTDYVVSADEQMSQEAMWFGGVRVSPIDSTRPGSIQSQQCKLQMLRRRGCGQSQRCIRQRTGLSQTNKCRVKSRLQDTLPKLPNHANCCGKKFDRTQDSRCPMLQTTGYTNPSVENRETTMTIKSSNRLSSLADRAVRKEKKSAVV